MIHHRSREEELQQSERVYVYEQNSFLSETKGSFSGAAALEIGQQPEGSREGVLPRIYLLPVCGLFTENNRSGCFDAAVLHRCVLA